MTSSEISLYFHIPFCQKKCPYCHFYSIRGNEQLKNTYLEALLREVEQKRSFFSDRQIVSIYFGGGTPFLFGVERIGAIIDRLPKTNCEITLEANPESVSENELERYRSIGVNRLSFGVQSFNKDELIYLCRQHSVEKAIWAIEMAKDFQNISIDLMYELPSQSVSMWKETLHRACQLPIHHISLYNLMIEPHCAWFRKKEEIVQPDEEVSCSMYEAAIEICAQHGFQQYEISAFSQPGDHSRHNIGYWQGREFLGFGASAFSFYDNTRFSNIADIQKYCSEGSVVDFSERLSPEERVREMLAIGLRMNEGVDLKMLEERWGSSPPSLSHFESLGLVEQKETRILLTDKGRLVYDALASEII